VRLDNAELSFKFSPQEQADDSKTFWAEIEKEVRNYCAAIDLLLPGPGNSKPAEFPLAVASVDQLPWLLLSP